MQGLLLHTYAGHAHSSVVFLRFGPDGAAAWLGRMLPWVSSAAWFEKQARTQLNLAFSYAGLTQLGLPEPARSRLPQELRQGMAHPERAAWLGDSGEDDPATWELRDTGPDAVSAIALLYAREGDGLEDKLDLVLGQAERFGVAAEVLETYLPGDRKEHFGFAFGISQPRLGRARVFPRKNGRRIAPGDFVLGYPDADGARDSSLIVPPRCSTRELPLLSGWNRGMDLGLHGSYLVVRKLEQRVGAFWAYMRQIARAEGLDTEERAVFHAARLIGRWPNGAPLTLYPDRQPGANLEDEGFGYRERDGSGLGCPLGAHVRRANPRDSLGPTARRACAEVDRHRLLRRGRSYGPPLAPAMAGEEDGQSRGLLFVALNTSLSRQFEHVQHYFINGEHFSGLRGERDPLLGSDLAGGRFYTVPERPVRHRLHPLPRWVRVRGGGYFFLPGIRALNYLAEGP